MKLPNRKFKVECRNCLRYDKICSKEIYAKNREEARKLFKAWRKGLCTKTNYFDLKIVEIVEQKELEF